MYVDSAKKKKKKKQRKKRKKNERANERTNERKSPLSHPTPTAVTTTKTDTPPCTHLDVAIGTHTHVPVGTVQTLRSGEERSVADDVGVGSSGQRAVQIPVVGGFRAIIVIPVVHRGVPEEHIVGVVHLSVGRKEEQITRKGVTVVAVVCLDIVGKTNILPEKTLQTVSKERLTASN